MTEVTARFALDEDKARGWLMAALAETDAGRGEWDASELPEIGAGYRASSGEWASATAQLVERALREGIIADAQPCDLGTLAWEFIPSDGSGTAEYRWTLNAGNGTVDDPGELITVCYPSPEGMWGFGLNGQNREIAGVEAAMSALREAVSAGNDLDSRLSEYIAALPLAVRAPEIAQLAAMLPAGEWGADELGTVSNWLNGLGFDTTGDAEPFHADCACCMSGCNGGEPGTRCGNCHHVETGR